MKFSTLLKTMLVLFLTFVTASPIKAEEQQDPSKSPQLPVVYQNLQIPSHLTEPFFLFTKQPLYKHDPSPTNYTMSLVSPSGKVLKSTSLAYKSEVYPLQNGYGYFFDTSFFKHMEYLVYDKQGNLTPMPTCCDVAFKQIYGEWFTGTNYPGNLPYLYNAKTGKVTKEFPDADHPIYLAEPTAKSFDPYFLPYGKMVKDAKGYEYYKMGMRNIHGKILSKPFFDEYFGYGEGWHRVKINGQTHFISNEGKIMLKPSRNYKVESNMHSGAFIVSGKLGNEEFYVLMNKKGLIVSKKYAFIRPTSDGHFLAVTKTNKQYTFTKINAADKVVSPQQYVLNKPEQIKELKQTGQLFHTNTQIIANTANTKSFNFPHQLLINPTNETVAIEYTISGTKKIGVYTHDGKLTYEEIIK
ncbi:hypothetical protein BP422_10245 [Brevibacillus formosus]|uniref:WG repeat-containing protein n=1 Tax=Brevibacillus formosus TaxID=54913 RepID=A0A220MH87_9BACL|nr:hypothetical protein [Brevibacillus formosus]ASJ53890.1 hypothetical protein BP422_10245 [Brevibacillus formosus]